MNKLRTFFVKHKMILIISACVLVVLIAYFVGMSQSNDFYNLEMSRGNNDIYLEMFTNNTQSVLNLYEVETKVRDLVDTVFGYNKKNKSEFIVDLVAQYLGVIVKLDDNAKATISSNIVDLFSQFNSDVKPYRAELENLKCGYDADGEIAQNSDKTAEIEQYKSEISTRRETLFSNITNLLVSYYNITSNEDADALANEEEDVYATTV